mmetsp:Transcript_19592/g.27191  ORF Transcript_19592/g.27191 Transcript_19592/m.27191 type:complete len:422 (+) Transcript_19592:235-1500(+)
MMLSNRFMAKIATQSSVLVVRRNNRQLPAAFTLTTHNGGIGSPQCFSSTSGGDDGGDNNNNNNNNKDGDSAAPLPFKPRRRPNPQYRPLKSTATPVRTQKSDPLLKNLPKGPDKIAPFPLDDTDEDEYDSWEDAYGPYAADAIKAHRREEEFQKKLGGENGEDVSPHDPVEADMRWADYMAAAHGSTEQRVAERRALAMGTWDEQDRKDFQQDLDKFVEEQRIADMEIEDDNVQVPEDQLIKDDNDQGEDPNRLAHGEWGETVIQIDRVQKVQRGGTIVRYRCLMVGGNSNGCAGFGVGKAATPNEATEAASRMCRRNIFFVDRYNGHGITRDLGGRHNSCRIMLRATDPARGLRGHPLIREILVFFGVTNCSCKSWGNRNPFNVVRATFKALATHESLDDIAMKRGKRLLNVDRMQRLGI